MVNHDVDHSGTRGYGGTRAGAFPLGWQECLNNALGLVALFRGIGLGWEEKIAARNLFPHLESFSHFLTTICFSGLHHAACLLAFPPASYAHCWVCTWSPLLACWLGFGQGGLAPSVLTHWVTTTHFLGLRPVPRSRAYLGATTT